jgi:hypothetical protein
MSEDVKEGTKLCFRCEWRARSLETGMGPRHECKQHESAVYSCYMYSPVFPIILERNKGDKRPKGGGILGARMHGVGVYKELEKVLVRLKKGLVVKLLLPKEESKDGG